jgi:glycosyltransferase involved in cell wall biosynthesis
MRKSKKLPLVSIITPVYNGSRYIEQLILSVKSQDYPNIEHIIIDDGSKDDEATVSILKQYPHLRWWSRKNKGTFSSMNEGLSAASGEYICFIHADDLMAENAVQQTIDWLRNHQDFDGVYGLTSYINAMGDPYPIKYPFRHAPLRFFPYFIQLQHCSFYISHQTLLKNKLAFDTSLRFCADYDWILRIINADIRIGFINSTLSSVRIHKNQITSNNRKVMLKEKRMIKDRYGYYGFRFIFYFTIYQALNLIAHLRLAYEENRFTGIMDTLNDWVKGKIIPYIFNKP